MGAKIKLSAIRKNAGLKQAEVAKKLGVGRSTIQNWEAYKISPPADKLKEYLKVCGDFPIEDVEI